MANNLSIVNKRTITERIIGYSAILSTTLLLIAGYQGCENAKERAKVQAAYDSRKNNVEGQIHINNLNEARRVLAVYAKDNNLNIEDQKRLDLKIKAKLAANELAEKEKAKAIKLKPLDELISQKKHDEAEGLYLRLTSEGVITTNSPQYTDYSNKVAGISLEAQLETVNTELKNIQTKTGLDKIIAIDAFCASHTNLSVVTNPRELRMTQAESYVATISDYLTAREEPSKVLSLLEKFLDWSKNQNKELIMLRTNDQKQKNIIPAVKEYVSSIPRDEDREIHIGDKVRVTKKLGIVRGKPNEYYMAIEVPLNSEGIVTGKNVGRNRNESVSEDTFRVWIKDTDHIFAYNELKKSNEQYSSKILDKLNEIEIIYGGAK